MGGELLRFSFTNFLFLGMELTSEPRNDHDDLAGILGPEGTHDLLRERWNYYCII